MSFKPTDNRKVILASETQATIDALVEQCSQGNIPYSVLELATKEAKRAAVNHQKSTKDYKPKFYIGLELGLTAYKQMLEVGGGIEDVLVFAARECEEDIGQVLEAKNRTFYYSRAVVEAADKHPIQKNMVKSGHMDRVALKSSTSINQQLRRLRLYLDMHNRIVELESRVDKIEARAIVQEAKSTVQNKRLDSLDKLMGNKHSEKDTAIELSILGHSNKQISEIVQKHPKTISRWLKEYEVEQ